MVLQGNSSGSVNHSTFKNVEVMTSIALNMIHSDTPLLTSPSLPGKSRLGQQSFQMKPSVDVQYVI
jgi:hypothetical protein